MKISEAKLVNKRDGIENIDLPDEPKKSPLKEMVKKKRTKSGCSTCRRRKIKCDENRPICMKCKKHEKTTNTIDCVYPSDNILNKESYQIAVSLQERLEKTSINPTIAESFSNSRLDSSIPFSDLHNYQESNDSILSGVTNEQNKTVVNSNSGNKFFENVSTPQIKRVNSFSYIQNHSFHKINDSPNETIKDVRGEKRMWEETVTDTEDFLEDLNNNQESPKNDPVPNYCLTKKKRIDVIDSDESNNPSLSKINPNLNQNEDISFDKETDTFMKILNKSLSLSCDENQDLDSTDAELSHEINCENLYHDYNDVSKLSEYNFKPRQNTINPFERYKNLKQMNFLPIFGQAENFNFGNFSTLKTQEVLYQETGPSNKPLHEDFKTLFNPEAFKKKAFISNLKTIDKKFNLSLHFSSEEIDKIEQLILTIPHLIEYHYFNIKSQDYYLITDSYEFFNGICKLSVNNIPLAYSLAAFAAYKSAVEFKTPYSNAFILYKLAFLANKLPYSKRSFKDNLSDICSNAILYTFDIYIEKSLTIRQIQVLKSKYNLLKKIADEEPENTTIKKSCLNVFLWVVAFDCRYSFGYMEEPIIPLFDYNRVFIIEKSLYETSERTMKDKIFNANLYLVYFTRQIAYILSASKKQKKKYETDIQSIQQGMEKWWESLDIKLFEIDNSKKKNVLKAYNKKKKSAKLSNSFDDDEQTFSMKNKDIDPICFRYNTTNYLISSILFLSMFLFPLKFPDAAENHKRSVTLYSISLLTRVINGTLFNVEKKKMDYGALLANHYVLCGMLRFFQSTRVDKTPIRTFKFGKYFKIPAKELIFLEIDENCSCGAPDSKANLTEAYKWIILQMAKAEFLGQCYKGKTLYKLYLNNIQKRFRGLPRNIVESLKKKDEDRDNIINEEKTNLTSFFASLKSASISLY